MIRFFPSLFFFFCFFCFPRRILGKKTFLFDRRSSAPLIELNPVLISPAPHFGACSRTCWCLKVTWLWWWTQTAVVVFQGWCVKSSDPHTLGMNSVPKEVIPGQVNLTYSSSCVIKSSSSSSSSSVSLYLRRQTWTLESERHHIQLTSCLSTFSACLHLLPSSCWLTSLHLLCYYSWSKH